MPFQRYLKQYNIIYKNDTIYLYGSAYRKREIILAYLQYRWGDQYLFRPDFFAGLNRIEVIKIKEKGGREGEAQEDNNNQIKAKKRKT